MNLRRKLSTTTLATIATLSATLLAALSFPVAADQRVAQGPDQVGLAQTVQVPSLKVKERLRSIEQITVSSEKAPQPVQSSSQAVTDLLLEADQLDKQAAQTAPPRSLQHKQQ